LRRIEVVVVVVESGGSGGKWTNEAITATLASSDRKSKADKPRRTQCTMKVCEVCEREKWLCGDVVEARNN
jgi:hypothetical protein